MKSEVRFIQALLEQPDEVYKVKDTVKPEYLTGNVRKLYEVILENPEHDIISLSREAGVDATKYMGDEYLNLEEWAEGVVYDYIERSFQPVVSTLQNDNKHPQDRLDEAREIFASLSGITTKAREKNLEDHLNEASEDLKNLKEQGGLSGITTGYSEIDEKIHGWNGGKTYVIAARPGMGKSAFALNSLLKSGVNSLFFSLEMGGDELAKRLIVMLGQQSEWEYQTGRVDWNKHESVVEELKSERLRIVDEPVSMDDIEAMARKAKMNGQLELLLVDYLQLILGDKNKSPEQQISDNTRRLKLLSKELDIPVIELCQLSRKVEERGGEKRPMLSDLRYSGAIEQDADIVSFLYRPEYYGLERPEEGDFGFLVAKNRSGPIGDIWLESQLQYYRVHESNKGQFVEQNAPF